MPNFSEISGSSSDRLCGLNLDELEWRGGFDAYLRAVAARPELLLSLRKRALRGGDQFFPDPAGAIGAALEALGERPESPRWALLLECGSAEEWREWLGLLIQRFEGWTRTQQGALFAFEWRISEGGANAPPGTEGAPPPFPSVTCPIRELPLRLVPEESRRAVLGEVAGDLAIRVQGTLCPECERIKRGFLRKYRGDWRQMIAHVEVCRLLASETGGRCIARARWKSLGAAAPRDAASGDTENPDLEASRWPEVLAAANRGLLCLDRDLGEGAGGEFWRVLEWCLEPALSPTATSKEAPSWIASGPSLEYAVVCPVFRGEDFGEMPASLRERAVQARLRA